MNSILLISILLVSFVSIDCQSIHFCKALKDNKWKISYSLSVPNGTFFKKFVIIKDHFWELEYEPSTVIRQKRQDSEDTLTETTFKKGPVFLKDVWSKKSSFLGGDTQYHTAFGVRYGSDKVEWKQNMIGLVNLKAQKIEWSLIDRNFKDLIEVNSKKKTFDTGFGNFKPDIAYTTFGRQERHTIVFIEQKKSSAKNYDIQIQAYSIMDTSGGNLLIINETNTEWFMNPNTDPNDRIVKRYIVPDFLKETAEFYKIRGLFGTKVMGDDNGTIVLIEHCADVTRKALEPCLTDPYLVYCVVAELDKQPMAPGKCHPAITTRTRLVDCSNPKEWEKAPVLNQTEPTNESPPIAETIPPEAESHPPNEPNPESEEEKSGGWIWIVIVIVIIVIIIVIIILILLCCCKKKGETPGETPKEGEELPQSTEKSQSMGTVSAMGSTRSNFEKSSGDPTKNKPLSKASAKPSAISDTGPKTKLIAPSQAGPDSMSMPSTRSKIK